MQNVNKLRKTKCCSKFVKHEQGFSRDRNPLHPFQPRQAERPIHHARQAVLNYPPTAALSAADMHHTGVLGRWAPGILHEMIDQQPQSVPNNQMFRAMSSHGNTLQELHNSAWP
jgi:hypothetical protein